MLNPLIEILRPDKLNTGRIKLNSNFETIRLYINALEAALSNISSDRISKPVNQTTHGFVLGDVIRFNGSLYVKAYANDYLNSQVVGIVSNVTNANNFTYIMGGFISGIGGLNDIDGNPLSNGIYYLANAANSAQQGKLTKDATKYTNAKPVLIYLSGGNAIVLLDASRTALESQKPIVSFNFTGIGSAYFVAPENMVLRLAATDTNNPVTLQYSYKNQSGSFSTINGNNDIVMMQNGTLKITIPDTVSWDDETNYLTLSFYRVA